MNDLVLDDLTQGRAKLMEAKWVKGDPRDGEQCMVSPFDGLRRYGCLNILFTAATALFPARGLTTAGINDHPDTTFQDVMAIYDEAELLRKTELAEAG